MATVGSADQSAGKDVAAPAAAKSAEKAAAKPAAAPQAAPYFTLFRFATLSDKIVLSIAVVFATAAGCAMPLFSLIFGELLDSIHDPNDFESAVNRMCAIMTGIAAAAGVASYFQQAFALLAAERQVRRMRSAYMRALLRQDCAWYDEGKSGEVSTRMAEDTVAIGAGIGDKFTIVIFALSSFLSGVILGFVRGWQMALVMLALVPMFGIAAAIANVAIGGTGTKGTDAYARAGDVATEALSAIRTVLAFGGTQAEVARYDKELTGAEKVGVKKATSTGLSIGILFFTMFLVYGVGLWAGARFIINNRNEHPDCATNPGAADYCFTGGNVMQVVFALLTGAGNFGMLGPAMQAITTARAAGFRIFQTIDRVPAVDVALTNGLKPTAPAKGRIEFRGVCFSYPQRPDVPVLKDFNLVIEPGETVALCGQSGSGKSTIVALLQRWYDPQKGVVLLDGVDLRKYDLQWLRAQQALVQQEPLMFATTVYTNIALGAVATRQRGIADVTRDDVEAAARAANAHDFIMSLPEGYNTSITSGQISGGQKQRLALARALIRAAPILELDEATSALDTASERMIQRDIDRLLAGGAGGKRGMTAIVIAHRLSTVVNASRILVLKAGEVIESGTHAELMAKGPQAGVYAQMYELQRVSKNTDGVGATAAAAAAAAAVAAPGDSPMADTSTPTTAAADAAAKPTTAADATTAATTTKHGTALTTSKATTGSGKGSVEKSQKELDEEADALAAKSLPPVSRWRLYTYARPEYAYLALGVLCGMANGVVFPAFAIIFSRFLNVYFIIDNAVMEQKALEYMGWMFLIGAGGFTCQFLTNYCLGLVSERLVRRVRVAAFTSMLRQEVSWHDQPQHSAGRLTGRLAGDAALVKAVTGSALALHLQTISGLIVGLIIAFVASWRLSLVILAAAPLLGIAGMMQAQIMKGTTEQAQNAFATCGEVATESMSLFRLVTAFGLQEHLQGRFERRLEKPSAAGVRSALVTGVGLGLTQFAMISLYALAFYTGSQFMKQGWMTFEEMMTSFFSVTFAAMGLGQASGMTVDGVKADIAARSLFAIIDRTSAIDPLPQAGDGSGKKAAAPATAAAAPGPAAIAVTTVDGAAAGAAFAPPPSAVAGKLEFRDVHFAYPLRPDQPVLTGLNLTVEPGQTVGLVGKSGSGKSTVVQLLERFYDPAAGAVLLDGVPLQQWDVRAARSALGWVQQEAPLFGDSCRYNILYGKAGTDKPAPGEGVPLESDEDKKAKEAAAAAAAAGTGGKKAAGESGSKSASTSPSKGDSADPTAVAVNVINSTASAPAAAVDGHSKPVEPEVVAAAQMAIAHEFIEALPHGYATHVGSKGSQLSGGQKQRVAIARAIIRQPRVLLLDEASSALDSASERAVQASIEHLLAARAGEAKPTALIVAHRLSTLRNCDVIHVLDRGRVAESGSHAELMAKADGLYRAMALAQDEAASH